MVSWKKMVSDRPQSPGAGELSIPFYSPLALFRELGLSAYSTEDRFHQNGLLGVLLRFRLWARRCDSTASSLTVPLSFNRGKVLGIVPKTNLPNYRDFYEKRQFTFVREAVRVEIAPGR
ncbi:MAG: hypothetical protein ACXWIU_01430 [Limisphaerales bacterium]